METIETMLYSIVGGILFAICVFIGFIVNHEKKNKLINKNNNQTKWKKRM